MGFQYSNRRTLLHCKHYNATKLLHCISLHCTTTARLHSIPTTSLHFTALNSLHCTATIPLHCTHNTALPRLHGTYLHCSPTTPVNFTALHPHYSIAHPRYTALHPLYCTPLLHCTVLTTLQHHYSTEHHCTPLLHCTSLRGAVLYKHFPSAACNFTFLHGTVPYTALYFTAFHCAVLC